MDSEGILHFSFFFYVLMKGRIATISFGCLWINKFKKGGTHMKETKIYADEFCTTFTSTTEMLEFLAERAKQSKWIRKPTRMLKLVPLEKEAETIEEACEKATIIQYLLSDAAQIEVWPKVKKHLTAGKTLYFSHGFAITYKERTGIIPPADIDVILIAPKGSGTSLRRMFLQGRGLNSSYAVFQDASGKAKEKVIALGIGVGSGYLFETTFKREVYSDLTGERGTLMGAIQGIFAAQYDVLRANGHTPSEAFNETIEELTQSLMPLIAENGMDWMYANCSTTAQRGALDWWKKFRDATKPVFEELYSEVAKGNEAQRSIDTNSKPNYREGLNQELKELRESEMWQAGMVVRKLRPENN